MERLERAFWRFEPQVQRALDATVRKESFDAATAEGKREAAPQQL